MITGATMYFKRMELNGFKSFADPVTIEFTDGITCIVGPNGSGKSNISDALRWVLGEQSPKSLRGGKMEDVIFAGTENRKAKGMAEVTLVIDNTERTLPIDFAEVGITRRMYRSGESEYMINRTPCRLRDIRELIMDTGIGVEGYSIIGQGKISDIVSNKMESRREIFEEAAGIVKYRNKKAETEKSLDEARVNLDRVSDIVSEIEGRIGGLEEDSKKATEYLELREKYKNVEINVLLKNIEISDERVETAKTEIAELDLALDSITAVRDRKEEELQQLSQQLLDLDEQTAAARSDLAEQTEEIHKIISTRDLNRERLASLDKDDQRLADEIAQIGDRLARQNEASAGLQGEYERAEEETLQYQQALQTKEAEEKEALQALESCKAEGDELRNRILSLSSEAARLRAEAQSADSLKKSLERRAQTLRTEGESKEDAAEALRDQLQTAQQELAD
ncbi:MAG: AAA family ATPase, partial [Firmicutes bacterium]|nr:AAA family ATPase [Bacillota bacterium]